MKLSHSIPRAQNPADTTTKQHFEVEQPESPQSHWSLHATFPGGPDPQCENTGRGALQTLRVAGRLCCGVSPLPVIEG